MVCPVDRLMLSPKAEVTVWGVWWKERWTRRDVGFGVSSVGIKGWETSSPVRDGAIV